MILANGKSYTILDGQMLQKRLNPEPYTKHPNTQHSKTPKHLNPEPLTLDPKH